MSYDGPTYGSPAILGSTIFFTGEDLAHCAELWTTQWHVRRHCDL